MFWWRKAAEHAHAGAQFSLGVGYYRGEGVEQDYAQAADWFRKAAEQGHRQALNNLGVVYLEGRGVPKDLVLAYALFSLAAAQGHEGAAKNKARVAPKLSPGQLAEGQRLSGWKVGDTLPSASATWVPAR